MPPLPWLLNLNRIVIIIIINQYPHPYHYHPSHQPLPSIMRGGLCMSGMDSDHTRPRTISLLLLGSGITDYPSNSLSFLTRFSLLYQYCCNSEQGNYLLFWAKQIQNRYRCRVEPKLSEMNGTIDK